MSLTNDEKQPGSPGSHPHSDQRNWRPAESVEDYFHNVAEGLESFSERRLATLLGVSRAELWRAKQIAALPEDLFEELLAAPGSVSPRALANVSVALFGNGTAADEECCPHCGGLLCTRARIPQHMAKVLAKWERDQEEGP